MPNNHVQTPANRFVRLTGSVAKGAAMAECLIIPFCCCGKIFLNDHWAEMSMVYSCVLDLVIFHGIESLMLVQDLCPVCESKQTAGLL